MNTLTLLRYGRGHHMWWRAQLHRVIRSLSGLLTSPAAVPVRVRASRMLAVALTTLSVGMSANAFAQSWDNNGRWGQSAWGNQTTIDGQLVDAQVLVGGSAAPLYSRAGNDRSYFQAFKGRDYSIRLRNTTGQRVGVLITVDGLNVVNGERSSQSSSEPMYVLDPWESATIKGWRSSQSTIQKFVFVDEQRSYANRTDQANGDMGWIRITTFREYRPQVWQRDELKHNSRAPQSAPSIPELEGRADSREMSKMSPNESDDNPGTGWGEKRYDPVRKVWFQPERWASDRMVLRYEYESGLRALGIYPNRRHRTWERERGEVGYAQPPRW